MGDEMKKKIDSFAIYHPRKPKKKKAGVYFIDNVTSHSFQLKKGGVEIPKFEGIAHGLVVGSPIDPFAICYHSKPKKKKLTKVE